MASFSSLRSVVFSYIKFTCGQNCARFSGTFNFFRNNSSLRRTSEAFLITRTYQTSPETLKVEFSDSLSANLYYAWLRDSCRCSKCVHPISQQKLFDTTSLQLDISPRFCVITNKGELKVVWTEKDGDHVSLYDPYWLHRYAMGFETNLYETVHDVIPLPKYWTVETLEENLPQMEYQDIMQSHTTLKLVMEKIHKYGILFIRNVPCEPGEVIKVMDKIANIKETRWGSSFHIKFDGIDIDKTTLPPVKVVVDLHTDMDYLEKSPGIQAIHCLESDYKDISADVREILDQSCFVDGFHVAKCLKENHSIYFDVLAKVPVKFKLNTRNMRYFNYQPILTLNRSRDVTEIHYNNRLMAPLEGPPKSIPTFFAAFKKFGEYLKMPENRYKFSFKPGDMVILNNRRILHGGHTLHVKKIQKHLEGCFADMDELIAQYRSFIIKEQEKRK